jgi:acetolactate synthase-1/2/3 large subunit
MAEHGGQLAVAAVRRHGVDVMFTLSGGHLFVLYDGAVKDDLCLVDVRHEQTATFAAEGWAKVTRRLGCAALTAGPGVTNGVSAMTAARMNGTPMVVIGGRAPQSRWGQGSLQELDHLPIVASVVKRAASATSADQVFAEIDAACTAARTPHRGPAFVDIALDAFGPSERPAGDVVPVARAAADPADVSTVAKLVGGGSRPVLLAGGDVYWDEAQHTMRAFAEQARVPVFVNGMGRGTMPADHELAFSRVRSMALKEADVVLVAGTPLDFRLGFGRFGDAQVVHLCDSRGEVAPHAALAASTAGDLASTFDALAGAAGSANGAHDDWVARLRAEEDAKRAGEQSSLDADTSPIKPARVYGELRKRLDRDAIVIGDGGDFVSYAGKLIDSYVPGTFLDPGPYGCLGMGPGYALAAGLAHPDRQVALLLGDGAIGFALGDFEALVRHGVNIVAIVGNNGIWGLEKHPMQAIFGYDVVADLAPGIRYDRVVEAFGGHGELVEEPAQLGPALDRAFATPGVSLVNVLTDPADAYPRSSNLA